MQSTENIQVQLSEETTSYQDFFQVGSFEVGIFQEKKFPEDSGENEDSLFLKHSSEGDILFAAVADGAGGHPRGAKASALAIEQCAENFSLPLFDIMKTANKAILDLKAGARSTLSMLRILDDNLEFCSTGDSEMVHYNSKSKKLYSSLVHSPVGYQVEAGRIDQKSALEEEERHFLNHLLGDEFLRMSIDLTEGIKRGHCIVIGSDGLFDNFTHRQIADILFTEDFSSGFLHLCDLCKKRPEDSWLKIDDISFIAIRKSESSET